MCRSNIIAEQEKHHYYSARNQDSFPGSSFGLTEAGAVQTD